MDKRIQPVLLLLTINYYFVILLRSLVILELLELSFLKHNLYIRDLFNSLVHSLAFFEGAPELLFHVSDAD